MVSKNFSKCGASVNSLDDLGCNDFAWTAPGGEAVENYDMLLLGDDVSLVLLNAADMCQSYSCRDFPTIVLLVGGSLWLFHTHPLRL